MTARKSATRGTLLVAAVTLAGALSPAAHADEPLHTDLLRARRAFDATALARIQEDLVARPSQRPDDYTTQLTTAEAFLARATLLRNERKIRELPWELNDRYRALQQQWGSEGMPYAERALALAPGDFEKAQAERVLGELHTHLIRGPISGLINGPRARSHLGRALELASDDPECNRAIGLMYLNNPPITGGNLPRAIDTFRRCTEALPDDDRCPMLLAMAYRKHEEPDRAREAGRIALERNPDNRDALHLLEALESPAARSAP